MNEHNHVKDPSIFVDAAARLLNLMARVHFRWVGGTDNACSVFVEEKAGRLGLNGKLTWVPPVSRRRAAEFDGSVQGRRWQRVVEKYLEMIPGRMAVKP